SATISGAKRWLWQSILTVEPRGSPLSFRARQRQPPPRSGSPRPDRRESWNGHYYLHRELTVVALLSPMALAGMAFPARPPDRLRGGAAARPARARCAER